MKLLLSSYSFGAGLGSEPGVGWNVATELARRGHDITVLTTNEFSERNKIELDKIDLPIRIIEKSHGLKKFDSISTYKKWQKLTGEYAINITKNEGFDLIHHVTFNSYRNIEFIHRCGIPFLIGPIGGGETIPLSLMRELPLKSKFKELLRYNSLESRIFAKYLNACQLPFKILCSNPGTMDLLERSGIPQDKLALRPAIALNSSEIEKNYDNQTDNKPHFLFAGRMIPEKGANILFKALSIIWNQDCRVPLKIIGITTDEQRMALIALRQKNNLPNEALVLMPKMEKSELQSHMKKATSFIYPAFRDSGSMVVLEALGQGCIPITLDLTGQFWLPLDLGIKVKVSPFEQTILNLAEGMKESLLSSQQRNEEKNQRRIDFLNNNMTWQTHVDFLEQCYQDLTCSRSN